MDQGATRIGFIGLGVMGGPMAGHLCTKGFPVAVYNRSPEKITTWLASHEGEAAASPGELALKAKHIVACVGNDDDLREIAIGPQGAIANMAAGGVFIDHSTTSADVAREIAGIAAEHDIHFLDAPVSGGQAGAQSGALTVMCGGTQAGFELAKPIIECYAKAYNLMGPPGAGQLTKMVNQICIAGLLQGLSEGLDFGLRAGLDMDQVIDVISKGAAQSWQMDNRAKTMWRDEFDFGFAVDLMRKDLGIVMGEGKKLHAELAVTKLVDDYYADLQEQGYRRLDTSCLIKRLRDRA